MVRTEKRSGKTCGAGVSDVRFRPETVVVAQRFEISAYGGIGSGQIAGYMVGIDVIAELLFGDCLRYGAYCRKAG